MPKAGTTAIKIKKMSLDLRLVTMFGIKIWHPEIFVEEFARRAKSWQQALCQRPFKWNNKHLRQSRNFILLISMTKDERAWAAMAFFAALRVLDGKPVAFLGKA
jgi:hypothetical protein